MGLRGKRILYDTIVPTITPEAGKQSQRDTALNSFRDKLAYRFYFHSVICRKRYDDCLNALHFEFDKQPDTLIKHLACRTELTTALTRNKATTADLKKVYPFYSWVSRLI